MIISNVKRHAAIPLALLSAAILATVLLVIAGAKNNGTVELIDLAGDRSALDGIVIEGMIYDGYHEMEFRLTDGRATKQTTVYDKSRYVAMPFTPGAPLPSGDRFYELWPSFATDMDYEIRSFRRDRNGFRGSFIGTALVDTSLKYNGSGDGYTHTNYQEKGLALIGDRVFFAPPTTRDYTGTSGIYEVILFNERTGMQSPDSEQPETKLLTKLDLEGNSRDDIKGLEILGLEAVEGKLALISLIDGQIVIRGYDADSGDLLGETTLDAFVNTTPGAAGHRLEGETYAENYEAFADDDTGMLTLKFTNSQSTSENTHLLIASFSFRDGVTLLHEQKLSYDGRDGFLHGESNRFSLRNDKLYAIMMLRRQPADMNVLYDSLRERIVIVEVYESGQLTYRGTLDLDLNDDTAKDRFFAERHSFQYENYRYRQLSGLNIRDERGGD